MKKSYKPLKRIRTKMRRKFKGEKKKISQLKDKKGNL